MVFNIVGNHKDIYRKELIDRCVKLRELAKKRFLDKVSKQEFQRGIVTQLHNVLSNRA
jgi:hypothetical protein